MGYMKPNKSGSMDTATGMCSSPKNPLKMAAQSQSECGPGENADQNKANRLLHKVHKEKESLRGKSGM
jgi:hypothetical protein